eukprot:13007520-Alexandrium_andersonii.AAC.1
MHVRSRPQRGTRFQTALMGRPEASEERFHSRPLDASAIVVQLGALPGPEPPCLKQHAHTMR